MWAIPANRTGTRSATMLSLPCGTWTCLNLMSIFRFTPVIRKTTDFAQAYFAYFPACHTSQLKTDHDMKSSSNRLLDTIRKATEDHKRRAGHLNYVVTRLL